MFRDRIKDAYEGLTPSFKRLAEFILGNELDVAFMTATELAHALDVDAATVVRFSQALGYSGYRQLSHEIQAVVKQDLTAAYAVFANQGKWIQPYGIVTVTDSKGTVIWQEKPRQRVAMSRESAAVITDMLQGVVREGTAKGAQVLPGPVAGKTGTTNAFKDALFVGFSPLIATGVWTGQDDHTTLGHGETGARSALPIWIEYMKTAIGERSFAYFDIPDNLEQRWMDPVSGRITTAESPGSVAALFRKKVN